MRAIQQPFEVYFDLDGAPLEGGAIYIGEANKNPELYPVQVFTDKTGMQPIAQPIGTIGGYLSRNGSPCALFTAASYSMTVRNSRGEIVYNLRDSAEGGGQGGDGTQNALDDFGAVGDGTTDNFAAMSEMFSAVDSKIFIPAGIYNLESMVTIDLENVEICGVRGQTIIRSQNLSKMFDLVRMVNTKICGITFVSDSALVAAADGVICGSAATIDNSIITWCEFSAPTSNTGGFVVNGTSDVDNFFFTNNVIKNVGAKGLVFQGSVFSGLKLDLNIIQNTGLFAGADGTGLGIGDNADETSVSDTTLINTKTRAIDIYNCDKVVIENLISSRNATGCDARLFGANETKLTDCFFDFDGIFLVDGSNNTRASNVNIKTTAINTVKITGDSKFNEFHLGTFDNSGSVANVNNCGILTDGANVSVNRASHLKIEVRTGSVMAKNINTAKRAELIHCYNSTSGDVISGDLLDWSTFQLMDDLGIIWETTAKYTQVGSMVSCFVHMKALNVAGKYAGTLGFWNFPVVPASEVMGYDPDVVSNKPAMIGHATITTGASGKKTVFYIGYNLVSPSLPAATAYRGYFGHLTGDVFDIANVDTWTTIDISFTYPSGE